MGTATRISFIPCIALIATVAVLLAGCGKSLDAESAAVFQQAQQAFDVAKSPTDYLLAASLYQKLVDRGVQSGAVFYNQGNAYMRGGERGRAIACYRQAKRFLPRDPQLEANLQFALGDTSPRNTRSLIENLFFWQEWLSYPAKFQLTVAFAAITLGLGITGLLLHSSWWRRTAVATLAMTFLLGCSAMYDWYCFEQVRHGVVTTKEVTARKGNSESYEPALTASLREGTEFVVVEPRGDWLLVRLTGGQEGWLKSNDVVTY